MKITNKALTVVCGPTATGKTAYALKLAREKNGELISVDSRQVYKYLDIGTGKDLPSHSKFTKSNLKLDNSLQNYAIGYYSVDTVPLWLYDVVAPDQQFSAFEYALLARIVINDIWKRGKLPILVGGTGLYIKAVVDGFTEISPPDWDLRKKLNSKTVDNLQTHLQRLDKKRWDTMNYSDRQNPRRLIRAIEIAKTPKLQTEKRGYKNLKAIKTIIDFIGLKFPNKTLYERIDFRVDKRVKNGILDEIQSVLKKSYSWDEPGLNTIGYKQLRAYFDKKEPLEKAVQKWKYAEHAYARRQLTWFNKDKRIHWIYGTQPSA